MTQTGTSPLDPHLHKIAAWITQGFTHAQIVRALGDLGVQTSETAIRRAKKRAEAVGLDAAPPLKQKRGEPSVSIDGDKATVAGGDPRSATEITPEQLMEAHGFSSDDWDIDKAVVNKYDASAGEGRKMPLFQLKLWLVRKVPIEIVIPARLPGDYIAPRRKPPHAGGKPQLWVVAGDEQAPFHHRDVHQAMLDFLSREKPHGFVGTGDLTDQNATSRHKTNPNAKWNTALQADLDHAYSVAYDRRRVCEDMIYVQLPGNHDIRVDDYVIERADKLYGIKRADLPTADMGDRERPVLSLPYLLRLDELNIEWIDPESTYEHAQYKIGPRVAVRHGSRTGKNAALATIDRLTHSVIMGHTHGQSIQHRTIYDIERNARIITAVETGALCDFTQVVNDSIREKGQGLGYAVDPNWVNGFTTVTLWPDGSHHIDNAMWDGTFIHWRGNRYAA